MLEDFRHRQLRPLLAQLLGLPESKISPGRPAYGLVQITWDPSHDVTDLDGPPNRFDENAPGSTWQYNFIDATPPTITDGSVQLFDPAHATNTWQLHGGIDFVFPTSHTLTAGACLLVVNFDPASNPAQLIAFRARYEVPTA